MALPDSYTLKPGSIHEYFEALLNAEAPERFTTRFLEQLEFKSTNDRLFINILKELGFLDTDGVPTDRYYGFLDRSQSARVVAEGVREAYSDLFAVNKKAHELSIDDTKNKLRTLYKGTKKDALIARIASTFKALCEYADFDAPPEAITQTQDKKDNEAGKKTRPTETGIPEAPKVQESVITLDSLQYHINIVLPESKDQAVFDAIFKSLRDHLGAKK